MATPEQIAAAKARRLANSKTYPDPETCFFVRKDERVEQYLDESEQARPQEITDRNPANILVVCRQGRNRSREVAEILRQRGYQAEYRGIQGHYSGGEALSQEDINNADVIICASRPVGRDLVEKFGWPEKPMRIIGLTEGDTTNILRGGELKRQVDIKIEQRLDEMGLSEKSKN